MLARHLYFYEAFKHTAYSLLITIKISDAQTFVHLCCER